MTASRGIAVAGGQPFGVAYLLDGALHNNVVRRLQPAAAVPRRAAGVPRRDQLAERAERRSRPAARSASVTKSGTNLFHGDVFEFARHHRFNATSPFAAINPATGERRDDGLVRNQFGGTLGGPIVQRPALLLRRLPGHARRRRRRPTSSRSCRRRRCWPATSPPVASAQCNARGQPHAAGGAVRQQPDRPGAAQPGGGEDRAASCRRRPTRAAGSRIRVRPSRARDAGDRQGRLADQPEPLAVRPLHADDHLLGPAVRERTATSCRRRSAAATATSHSLAIGDTMVLSNTIVNNIRFAVNRTDVHRTHADFFGPRTSASTCYSYIRDYMLITVTGGFNSAAAPRPTPFYQPEHLRHLRRPDDDPRQPPVRLRRRASRLSDWQTQVQRPLAGRVHASTAASPACRLADFLLGRVVRVPAVDAVHAGHHAELFRRSTAQDTWRLSPNVTLNYGVRWEPWFPQQHQNGAVYNFTSTGSAPASAARCSRRRLPDSPIPATRASRARRA